jgi:hypothetical protein
MARDPLVTLPPIRRLPPPPPPPLLLLLLLLATSLLFSLRSFGRLIISTEAQVPVSACVCSRRLAKDVKDDDVCTRSLTISSRLYSHQFIRPPATGVDSVHGM